MCSNPHKLQHVYILGNFAILPEHPYVEIEICKACAIREYGKKNKIKTSIWEDGSLMEKEVNTYQQFNFQIALDKIEELTNQNNELLDMIDRLEIQLKDNKVELTHELREPRNNKFQTIANEADAAMKRFTAKLKKETNNNAKSKQAKGKSI